MGKYLEVYGAKTHNLKNVNIKIPKNKITVITGLSGSGKSSLAFNTIYSLGQQKYLESLSSYARMFVGGLKEEAEVEEIIGLSPTISIDQKTTNKNPRSTVGTITEIYDYYKILYLNVGTRKCVKCLNLVKKESLKDIIKYILSLENFEKFIIKSPFKIRESFNGDEKSYLSEKLKKEILNLGFIRFQLNGKNLTINDDFNINKKDNIDIVIDRLIKKDCYPEDSSDIKRLKDSLELAFKVGNGLLKIEIPGKKERLFSNIFICSKCGHIPENLNISSFSFNSHSGACLECHGLGAKTIFLEENIINPKLTLLEGAVIVPGFGGNYFFALLEEIAKHNEINLNNPYSKLSSQEKKLILHGTGTKIYKVNFTNEYGEKKSYNSKFEGVVNTLTRRYFEGGADKGLYDEFITEVSCPTCFGKRLKKESLSVYLNSNFKPKKFVQNCPNLESKDNFLDIGDLSNLSVLESLDFLINLNLSDSQNKIASKALKNVIERLEFLKELGLNYITISRKSGTLSGGEAQRIRLATQIGTKLEGIIYVLDEPSIGLHSRDNNMLIKNLQKLRNIGNTVIIVEHDEDIMKNSDYIIDIGPGAGIHGGEIVAEGDLDSVIKNPNSVTGPYLSGEKKVLVQRKERKLSKFIEIKGASQNNLKNIDLFIPLGNFVCVSGVSGSGKSSLVNDVLANYLLNKLNRSKKTLGKFKEIKGYEYLDKAIVIDQSPIGRTPRSNPATYTGVFTNIRDVFALVEESKIRGYAPGRFSFNTKDGRCLECEGDGVKKIEMHFLPPVYVDCESCNAKRYNFETLQIKYKGKNISDVLDMTVEEASLFFENHFKIIKILSVLDKVGLGYIKLGQSSTTLSGGEAQRIKLATELSKRSTSKTFYILDEPTTGLHFQDVERLLKILHSLVDKGNTVLVIEHNMDIIINSDYIIDVGLEGGDSGGNLVACGSIEEVKKNKHSFTAEAIRKYLLPV